MTSRTRFRAVVVLLIAAGAICAAAGVARAEKVSLRLKLAEGKTYNLKMTAQQKISQTIGGRKVDMDQTLGMGYSFAVTDVDAEGTISAKVTYDSVLFRQKGPTGTVEYDSAHPTETVNPMAKAFAAQLGQSFTLALTPEGRITKVEGVDKLFAHVLRSMDIPAGPQRDALEKSPKQQFGDQAMQDSMEQLTAIYPDGPVDVGDSWERKVTMAKGFPMQLENTWQLKSRKDGRATIDVKSKISSNANADPISMGPVSLKYDFTGDQKGELVLDEATGWTVSAKTTQKLTGKVNVKGAPGMPAGMSWPITIESTITLESSDE